MTALDQYERLESDGLWRETADAQRRDVLVSFGHATLVISDTADRPLAHWSLPAIIRLNEGARPALFAPADDADETLEIADDTMIDAIEKIRRGLRDARSTKGRLRGTILAGLAVVAVGLGVFWFPSALREQTLSVVPHSKRVEMGATILGHLQSAIGPRCTSDKGQRALTRLSERLFGSTTQGQIVVLSGGIEEAIALPGNIIVIDKARVQGARTPEVVAGYALAAYLKAQSDDAFGPVIDQAGLQPTFHLLTTGDLPPEALETYADTLIEAPQLVDLSEDMVDGFASRSLDIAPLLSDLSARGRIVPSELQVTDTTPPLSDSEWIALSGICDA